MEFCEKYKKNLDEFELKYIPKSPFERIIRKLENKNKSTIELGMMNKIYTVSSKHDDTDEHDETEDKSIMEKACYAVEPREKDLALNEVYGVLKSDKHMMLSGAAPFFGPPKKLGNKNRMKNVMDDIQSLNWNLTSQQARSTKLKNLQCDKNEGKSKVSPNNSFHIMEVVNVADDQASHDSSEIQANEQIAPENEKSDIIERSSDNDETLYTEMVDLCNEIKIVNEDESDLFNDYDYEGGGLRTEFYDMRPDTPMDSDQMFKSESQVSKAKSPTKRYQKKVIKTERLQMKAERPERPQTRSRRPERRPTRERRSDSQDSNSSLENVASQVVQQVSDYQERIYKYLSRIYDIICEPQEPHDINDLGTRQRRSSEFTALFVRTHLYQIGHMAERIRTLKENPVDIMTKVNSLFQLVMQGVQSYLKNLEGFIYNNRPEKLLVLTDYVLNAIKVCFERRTCSMEDKDILKILKIIDEIRYCVESCNQHGYLQKSFCGMLKKKQPIDNENLEAKVDDEEMNFEHGILMDSRPNSKEIDRNSLKGTRHNEKPCTSDSFLSNDSEEKLSGSRENSNFRKNAYGYAMKSPYGMSSSPYEVPKMKAKPKVASSRSNLNSTKSSNYGSRLNSSKSSVQTVGLHSDKNDNHKPDRHPNKGNPGLHPTKSTVCGTNLQKSKGLMQKPGLHATKSTVHELSKNAVQNSKLHTTKSTVYEVKKSSSDVSTVMQREREKQNQLSAIEEDSESDQSSEAGSKKSSESGSKKSSEAGSKKSSKCESLKKLRFDSDNDSSTSSSVKSVGSRRKSESSSDKSDKESSKCLKNSTKNDKKSSKGNQNCPKVDKTHQNIDNPQTKLNDILNNPRNDLNGLMKIIKNLTKEKFESMVVPMVSKHVSSKDVKSPKAEKMLKSVHRVTADVKPLKKPKSIVAQRSMVNYSEDSNSSKSESSSEDDDDDLGFSKYTSDELREMAIKEQQMRLEKIKKNPLYYQEGVDEPWKLLGEISEHIIDELLVHVVDESMTGSNVEDKKRMEKFIESDSSESECSVLNEIE